MRVLSSWSRKDVLLLAVGVAIIAAAVTLGVVLGTADETASTRPAAARTATIRVIPAPKRTAGRPALPNSTVCRIGGKCRNFSYLETVDIARDELVAYAAIRGTWGTGGFDILASGGVLRPQVRAAATTYVHLFYCMTLRFPDPGNAYFITAGPYGPRGHYGC